MDVHAPLGVILFGRGGFVCIRAGESKMVGASEACALRVQDFHVSGRHFEVFLDDRTCFIRDLGSKNGTYVNGVRLCPDQSSEITNGAVIDLQEGVGFLILIFPLDNLERFMSR